MNTLTRISHEAKCLEPFEKVILEEDMNLVVVVVEVQASEARIYRAGESSGKFQVGRAGKVPNVGGGRA